MVAASSLKKGEFVEQDSEPYYVEKAKAVVIGRHSHTKMKIDLQNMFSGERRSLSASTGEEFEKVDVIRKHGQLIANTGDRRAQVMDMKEFGILDCEIKKGLDLIEGDEITYIDFKGRAMILEKRG